MKIRNIALVAALMLMGNAMASSQQEQLADLVIRHQALCQVILPFQDMLARGLKKMGANVRLQENLRRQDLVRVEVLEQQVKTGKAILALIAFGAVSGLVYKYKEPVCASITQIHASVAQKIDSLFEGPWPRVAGVAMVGWAVILFGQTLSLLPSVIQEIGRQSDERLS